LVPSNHGNNERHLAPTTYPSYEKPHTRYPTNMKGSALILVVHFRPKILRITFLNERGKISPLRYECHFTAHVTEGVRMI